MKELDALRATWNLARDKINRKLFGRYRYDLLKIVLLKEAEQRLLTKKRVRVELFREPGD